MNESDVHLIPSPSPNAHTLLRMLSRAGASFGDEYCLGKLHNGQKFVEIRLTNATRGDHLVIQIAFPECGLHGEMVEPQTQRR